MFTRYPFSFFFFFNDTATTEIYTLSLHDALPICGVLPGHDRADAGHRAVVGRRQGRSEEHTSELQSPCNLVCRLLLEKKKKRQLLHCRRMSSHPYTQCQKRSLQCTSVLQR